MIKIHQPPKKKPDWLKIKLKTTSNYNDMKKLINFVKDKVMAKTGIRLELEVILVE